MTYQSNHLRTPRPSLDLAVIFVPSHNTRYRSAVAWARKAEAAEWRADEGRDGIWVGRGWLRDDIRVYGPFDKLRELPYDASDARQTASAARPAPRHVSRARIAYGDIDD